MEEEEKEKQREKGRRGVEREERGSTDDLGQRGTCEMGVTKTR